MILNKEKNQMSVDIESSLAKIRKLEERVFGVQLMELQTDNVYLQTIQSKNLKSEFSENVKNKFFIHWNIIKILKVLIDS